MKLNAECRKCKAIQNSKLFSAFGPNSLASPIFFRFAYLAYSVIYIEPKISKEVYFEVF